MTVFHEYTFYSPMLDAEAVRLSTVNARNHEFFMILPRFDPQDARKWRDRREEALGYLQQAIRDGLEPGEVEVE